MTFKGSLVKLSAKGAEVNVTNPVPALSNIKFNFSISNYQFPANEDVYAKVLEKETVNGNFYIHFTSLPPDVEAILENIYKSCATKEGAV
jgi:adenylate cyclase